MRPLDELTMYAGGLLDGGEEAAMRLHVDGCGSCAETVRRLRSEHRLLERAAEPSVQAVAPPALLERLPSPRSRPRVTLPAAGLSAAAVLLAALAWILFRAPRVADVGPAVSPQATDDLDRLVSEFKSSSALRREIAALALKAYGGPAGDKLEKAGADPNLVDDCRGVTPPMRAVMKKLETMKLDLSLKEVRMEDALAFVRGASGISILADAGMKQRIDPDATVTLEAKGLSVGETLRRICTPAGLKIHVLPEAVILLSDKDPAPPAARAPIRIPGPESVPSKEIEALASDSPDVRDRATAALRRLGFAAERSLWAALEARSPEARARVADLLRSLYARPPAAPRTAVEDRLVAVRVTIDMQNASLTAILGYISEISEVSIVIDTEAITDPDDEKISFKVSDITLDGALRLMLQPRRMTYAVAGDAVVATTPGRLVRAPRGPFWTDPEKARRIELLVGDLASNDSGRQSKAEGELLALEDEALGPLLEAASALEGSAAARCRLVAGKLASWLVDEPSGADLQPLDGAQKRLLGRPLAAEKRDSLEEILKRGGLKHSLKAKHDHVLRFSGPSLKTASLLRILTRPYGLDFYLDGETVVIDTAANVRAAVTKK